MNPPTPPNWPAGIERIRVEDLGRLGIDDENQLFWDGKRVEVRRRLDLTRLEKTVAAVVTVAAVLGGVGAFLSGLNDGSAYLCERGVHLLGCPLHP